MLEKYEEDLIKVGITAAIEKLRDNLHSEDDHGYDLYKWLDGKKQEIAEAANNKVLLRRAMIVD